ncbi:MAG: YbaB/EbfC family nucleoid-associated protein [Bdellovibrionota bacterium]|nr:YbaB/EbfC family nucleoid-associated protein [Pseudobdellovibrionaceae bacterium]|tara:strand:+ start:23003 stop:23329 length:327 start_codon:yes stop_codon:yes gene_type:complete
MKGGFPGGGMQGMMKQMNQMKKRMEKVQEELAQREYEGTAGGEAVKVIVKGENNIDRVEISEDLAKSGDQEMIQDLIALAANDALKKAKEDSEKEMGKITGPLGMFGM